MTIEELGELLVAEGYCHLIARSPGRLSLLDFDLERSAAKFIVCDRERGEIVQIWLETEDEAEACELYRGELAKRFLFLVGTSCAEAIAGWQAALISAEIEVRRNDIPGYGPGSEPKHRLFVRGEHLGHAQSVLYPLK